jgi:hypothetical protein
MCSDKLSELLGTHPFRPWPLDPELMPDDRHWHASRKEMEHGSASRIRQQLYKPSLSFRYEPPASANRL